MRLIPWRTSAPKLIEDGLLNAPAPFGRFTRGVFKGWPCPDMREAINASDAGRAPSNEPEPPRAQQPDKPATQPRPRFCAYCGARWKPDTRGYCCGCGAPLARAEWPPESQEARAASTGQTRTK